MKNEELLQIAEERLKADSHELVYVAETDRGVVCVYDDFTGEKLIEVPRIALLRGMCVRITLFFLVFGGRRRRNNRGVYDRTFFQNQSSLGQCLYNQCKELFMDMVLNQQIPEPSDGIAVRNLVARFHFTEIRKSPAVDDFVPGPFVGQVIEILDQVDFQHQFKIVGLVAAHSFIIARLDQLVKLFPRHDGVHLFKKFPFVRFYFF